MSATLHSAGVMLAFDLSTPRAVVALGSERVLECRYHDDMARHLAWLTGAAHTLLAEEGVSPRELAGVVVGRGPGSFTGIRTAVVAAKTISWSLGIPLAAPLTLDVLAAAAPDGLTCAALDARRGELYYRFYEVAAGEPRPLSEPAVAPPETVEQELRLRETGAAVTMVGNGAAAYADLFGERSVDRSRLYPAGEELLRLGRALLASGKADDPLLLTPFYLRPPDFGAAPACPGGERLG